MNINPERIPFSSVPEWESKIQQRLETLSAGRLDDISRAQFFRLISESVSILEPFLNAFEGGWFSVAEQEGVLCAALSTPLFLPERSLSLPKAASGEKSGVLAAFRRCLYETVAFASLSNNVPALSDGLFRFGMLKGTGYYWSLSDHRERLLYEEHPRTFDEFSYVIPTDAENHLENIKLVYDNNELELVLCLRLPQEVD